MMEILTQVGVPPAAIIQEPNSFNTYENAVNVKQILQSRGIKNILLVTSALHMPRSLAIFKRQKITAVAAPTDFLASTNEFQESIAVLKLHYLPFPRIAVHCRILLVL